MVWLDAFSDKYLSPRLCPFMWSVSKIWFFAKISPLFAYTGIKNCFNTGISINTLKIWNDHAFNGLDVSNGARITLFKKLLHFIDRISPNDEANKILRYLMFKIKRVEYGVPHLIPVCLIDLFPHVEPKKTYKQVSLYEVLREQGIKFVEKMPKLNITESVILRRIPRLLKRYDALFIKLNSLDRLGHKYGPSSDIVKRRVRCLDELLRHMVKALDKDATLIVMSDHGMVPVMHTIDLIDFLKHKEFKFGHHYVGFIGATYASFWFKQEEYRNAVKKELSALGVGRFLTFNDKLKLGIDGIGKEYGEEIFAIKEHYVCFPEFYHWRRPPKGMHGYAFSKWDMPIFLMHSDLAITQRKNKIEFIDIMPTIFQLLDLPVPSYVEGQSLI